MAPPCTSTGHLKLLGPAGHTGRLGTQHRAVSAHLGIEAEPVPDVLGVERFPINLTNTEFYQNSLKVIPIVYMNTHKGW